MSWYRSSFHQALTEAREAVLVTLSRKWKVYRNHILKCCTFLHIREKKSFIRTKRHDGSCVTNSHPSWFGRRRCITLWAQNKMKQYPAVTSFRNCSQAQLQRYRVIWGSCQQSNTVQIWNNLADSDFPEEKSCCSSSVPVFSCVCVPLNLFFRKMQKAVQR